MLKAELKLKFSAKRQKVSAFRLRPLAFSLQPSAFARSACRAETERRRAFTLIEMLVVLAILGILAALTVPALKNFGHSDAMTAADQQMLGAVARARQLAMSQRTTVYLVFVPANFWNLPCTYGNQNYGNLSAGIGAISSTPYRQTAMDALTNLCGDQLTGYNFVAYGAMGDQPGQHQWHYLEKWQTLPDGIFIDTNKFATPGIAVSSSLDTTAPAIFSQWNQAYPHSDYNTIYAFTNSVQPMPFPTADSPLVYMPCIAFNYLGQLTFDGQTVAGRHEYIPLARGVVAPATSPDTQAFTLSSPKVIERPPNNSTTAYNIINIDPLTGRATLETPKIQ